VKTGVLDVRVAASPSSRAQVGVIVPKYKRTIVERNRLRRRLRELARVRLLPVLEGTTDERPARAVLIRALPVAYSASFDGLAREIDAVVARIG
jgi:ribonuclease P protein component